MRRFGALALVVVLAAAFPAHSSTVASPPLGHYLFESRGLVAQFEQRGSPFGYVWGQAIQQFHEFDPVVGSTVESELKLQLDQMRALGVNEIWYELRTADPVYLPEFKPPECNEPPVLGLQWPQPTPTELANLGAFFDVMQNEGMHVVLELVNTHMEEQPPTNAERWLGSILDVVKDKPALELVQFDGTPHLLDLNGDGVFETCGTPAEAPLWMGPTNVAAQYVRWAVRYGISLGIPAHKLSAESIVGNYLTDSHQPTGPAATGGHFWAPVETMKTIFDELGIPASERTYALSFYEHRKCAPATGPPQACVDESPHAWAEDSLRRVREVVGPESRLHASEFGPLPPVEGSWPTDAALESLTALMRRYGVDGGDYWQWVDASDANEHDSGFTEPVKRRGARFVYTPVRLELLDMYGFHLASIPNGSFENRTQSGRPNSWMIAGRGRAAAAPFTGNRTLPWRGRHLLRLFGRSRISATSAMIRVTPGTTYTTTGEFRARTFSSSVSFRFFTCSGRRSAAQVQRSFPLQFTSSFTTVPLRYTTPPDACYVRIEIVAKHGAVDADDLH